MATEEYVLYALLALIVIGIIAFVIYRSKAKKNEQFRKIKTLENQEKAKRERFAQQQAMEEEGEFTNIVECPCADLPGDCPDGCACSACAMERYSPITTTIKDPFADDEEAPIYMKMNNPDSGSGAIADKTSYGDPIRGDIAIGSPSLSDELNVPSQKSRKLAAGASNIVFGGGQPK
jgi:hypothetical protein